MIRNRVMSVIYPNKQNPCIFWTWLHISHPLVFAIVIAEEVYTGSPYLSKLESIASSAVRAASKVNASLLVVYTHSGQTAKLVAKYRPKMPILTLVVPQLVSDSLSWKLEVGVTCSLALEPKKHKNLRKQPNICVILLSSASMS